MAASAARQQIPFNRTVLKWARERRNILPEVAAKRVNVPLEKFTEWEAPGGLSPTVVQARKLAELYELPFLHFFSKDLPKVYVPNLVPDFRFHKVPPSKDEMLALSEVQQWAEEQRVNALDLLEIIGDEVIRFPENLYADLSDDFEAAASKAREAISFPIEKQLSLNSKQKDDLPNIFRYKLEAIGVLVLKQNGISNLRTRGICLFAEPLPVIIFGGEAPSAQSFTLAHELGHIVLKRSAISGAPRFGKGSENKRIESWCNKFAAAFLMPERSITSRIARPARPMDSVDDVVISKLAKAYGVSQHAMLIRLMNLAYVKPEYYWFKKRPEFIAQEEAFIPFGRPPYYGSRFRSSRGDFYTGLVLEAWNTGRITNHNAAEFMGIKNLEHLDEIRTRYGR